MLGKNVNISENFRFYNNEKSILKKRKIKKDYKNLINKNLNTRNHAKSGLLGYTSQARLFTSELLASLKEVKFNKKEFFAGKLVSDIKYYYPNSQNNNSFYLFNN